MSRAVQAIFRDSLLARVAGWFGRTTHSLRDRLVALLSSSGFMPEDRTSHKSGMGNEGEWSLVSVEACLASLDEMRDLAQTPGAGDSLLAGDLVNVPIFAEQFVSQHAAEANAHAVRMVVDVPPDALVIGDASGLHRTIDSFLVNALANTPEGGCLTIRGNIAQGFVTLTALCTQHTLRRAETPRGNLCLSLSLPVT